MGNVVEWRWIPCPPLPCNSFSTVWVLYVKGHGLPASMMLNESISTIILPTSFESGRLKQLSLWIMPLNASIVKI
jgi:hypothetical protein